MNNLKAAHPESTVKMISLKTLRRADSVLWRGLKPDWNFSKISFLSKKDNSWVAITFSNTLDKNSSLEMGWKLERTEGSRLGFLISGCTIACLRGAEKHSELKQAWTNVRMKEPMELKTFLKRQERMLSVGQFVGRRSCTMSDNSNSDISSNLLKTAEHIVGSEEGSGATTGGTDCRPEILSTKKFRKSLQRAGVGIIESVMQGLTRESRTGKSFLMGKAGHYKLALSANWRPVQA